MPVQTVLQFQFTIFLLVTSALCNANVITVDNDVTGPIFHGIGAIAGGGAISRLLIEYPDDVRTKLLDYLFSPNYGASLHILKVEIGGDGQSTEGVESSIKHYEWEKPNAARGYEWWTLTEAKKRNPNIKIWCLPWAFPGWLGEGETKYFPYVNVSKTANYIIDWLKVAQSYNITVDWVGIWNEKPPYAPYIVELRKQLDQNGFQNVLIDASDNRWEIRDIMEIDRAVYDAVAAIGVHYPGCYRPEYHLDRPTFSSEDDSTDARLTKTGCIARILNQNFVRGNYTATILWNIIAAFYDNLPFPRTGLISASEPWSGWYQVESALWAVAHTTQFTRVGWKYLKSASALLHEGGSVTGYVSPNAENLTLVIEAASYEEAKCVRPALTKYETAEKQTVTLKIDAKWKSREFVLLKSKVTRGFETKNMMQYVDTRRPNANSEIVLTVERDDLWTVTTMPYLSAKVDRAPKSAPSAAFPSPYLDDFEDTEFEKEGRYWMQQNGVFEVVPAPTGYSLGPGVGSIGKRVLRQRLLTGPVTWCPYVDSKTYSVVGDYAWTNVNITAVVSIPSRAENGSDGVMLGARMQSGGCAAWRSGGLFAWFTTEGLSVSTNVMRLTTLCATRDVRLQPQRWTKVTLVVKNYDAAVYVDDKPALKRCKMGEKDRQKIANGFAAIGTPSYGFADFDGVEIIGDTTRASTCAVLSPFDG